MTSLSALHKLANPCRLCIHNCSVDREKGEKGFCRSGSSPAVYSCLPHFGEEPPISGTKGSGAIFFAHCNMRCVYCQNHLFSQDFSETKPGNRFEETGPSGLAEKMLELQNAGCHT